MMKTSNMDDMDYTGMGVEVFLAMSEKQAEKQGCAVCIMPELPQSRVVYSNLDKIPDELCIEKKIDWEIDICAYKRDFDKIKSILYPNGCDFDFQRILDKIDGDKFYIIGFSN